MQQPAELIYFGGVAGDNGGRGEVEAGGEEVGKAKVAAAHGNEGDGWKEDLLDAFKVCRLKMLSEGVII